MNYANAEQQAELLNILKNIDKVNHEILEQSIIFTDNEKKMKYLLEYGGFPGAMVFGRVIFFDSKLKQEESLSFENKEFTDLMKKILEDRKNEVLSKKQRFANGILSIFTRKVVRA